MKSSQLTAMFLPRENAYLKMLLFFILFAIFNIQILRDVIYYLSKKEFGPIAIIALTFTLSLIAFSATALNRSLIIRLFWGLLFGLSAGFTACFTLANSSLLTLFDLVSLWNSAASLKVAICFFIFPVAVGVTVFLLHVLAFALPPNENSSWSRSWLPRWSVMPIFPIIFIAYLYSNFSGVLYFWPPLQMGTLSLTGLMGYSLYQHPMPPKQKISWVPETAIRKNNIVVLMDETLRGDYIDFKLGNPYTPQLANLAGKFVNFGPAVSTSDCSHFSNSLVRFGVSRKNFAESATLNPSVFEYAKHAGFRTVYIDAQASTYGKKLVNFMTAQELTHIDQYYPITDAAITQADQELADIVANELSGNQPVFIYANKVGSHFPYEWNYPSTDTNNPTSDHLQDGDVSSRIASYRKSVAWSVDHFMDYLFKVTNLADTTLLFTGDHGESFSLNKSPHCQSGEIEAQVGLVPLLVYASDPAQRLAFEKGAALSINRTSHFMIAPTLYRLMGYRAEDIKTAYDESLFEGTTREPAFLTGDIYNFFGGKIRSIPVDLKKTYLEPEARTTREVEN